MKSNNTKSKMKSEDLKEGQFILLKKGIFISPYNATIHRIVKITSIYNYGKGFIPYFVAKHICPNILGYSRRSPFDESYGESAYQIGNIERELNEEEVKQYEVENEI